MGCFIFAGYQRWRLCVLMDPARETFDINFFGTLRLTQAVLLTMEAKQSERIVESTSRVSLGLQVLHSLKSPLQRLLLKGSHNHWFLHFGV